MKVEFVGPDARDPDNWQAASCRLVNCYREPSQGKTGHTVKSDLGMSAFSTLSGVFFRAMAEVSGNLYAACGSKLWKIDVSGGATSLGATADGAEATIAGNNGNVTACIGGNYYVWDGTTLSTPAPGAFSAFGSLAYIGNYTVLTEKGGRRFQWSSLAAPATLPGLNFSTADGRDDNIVRCAAVNGQLYIFKEKSHEIWYVTGQANAAAFERQAGGVNEPGLLGFGLLAKVPGATAFFIGSDGKAYIVGVGPVSIPPVETAIRTLNPDRCLCWEDEGHVMCAIVFKDAPAWVYDLSTGEWHERARDVTFDPWPAAGSAKLGQDWFVGRSGGGIYKLARTNVDDGVPLVRSMVSRTLDNDGALIRLSQLEVFLRSGLAAGSVELRLSKDNGMTWGMWRKLSWGVGQYAPRLIWRALGMSRQWVAEIRTSEPVEVSVNAEGRVA